MNENTVKQAAEHYVRQQIKGDGYFTFYPVVIGKEKGIVYADSLPPLIASWIEAEGEFFKRYDASKNYLVRVNVNPVTKELTSEIKNIPNGLE